VPRIVLVAAVRQWAGGSGGAVRYRKGTTSFSLGLSGSSICFVLFLRGNGGVFYMTVLSAPPKSRETGGKLEVVRGIPSVGGGLSGGSSASL